MSRALNDSAAAYSSTIEATRVRRTGEMLTLGSATAVIREKIPKTSITVRAKHNILAHFKCPNIVTQCNTISVIFIRYKHPESNWNRLLGRKTY